MPCAEGEISNTTGITVLNYSNVHTLFAFYSLCVMFKSSVVRLLIYSYTDLIPITATLFSLQILMTAKSVLENIGPIKTEMHVY